MISVDTALSALFALAEALPTETVPLRAACNRVMPRPASARRTQPPFAASAMDGYALRLQEREPGAMFKIIGEAAAGHAWPGQVQAGQAVRIFTGAPVPEGADCVVIQEDVERRGDLITLLPELDSGAHIRPSGGDFQEGDTLSAPRRLSAADIALLASMNRATVDVTRAPIVALISTGDELVMPGEAPRPDQIIASNTFGLAAMLEHIGAEVRILPIARDTEASLTQALSLARGADLIVTIGGASVGDHDIVAPVAESLGMERAFYKIAMRPGKPLMAGRLGTSAMVGLPGNPVSAMVCGQVFLRPLLEKMLGLGEHPLITRRAFLAAPLGKNGPRQHYMRARIEIQDGTEHITAYDRQDSSLLTILAEANALLVRPPHDPALDAGSAVEYLPLPF